VPRILVIHYDAAEGARRAERLSVEGFEAEPYMGRGSQVFHSIRENPPDAILIDLTRMPSYGQYMAALLRQQKGTRRIPLVFLEGDPEKAAKVRKWMPDAGFATLPRLAAVLRRAIRTALEDPVAPKVFATPLPQKLRIRENSVVALLHAPQGFEERLTPLPDGVRFRKGPEGADVILMFVKSAAALGRALPLLHRYAGEGRALWVCWPKKASKTSGDLTLPAVWQMASAVGMVGSKICAVDETWSASALGISRAARAGFS
jgi:CheY-like chemotaxis protein